jgi:hypothetical protein
MYLMIVANINIKKHKYKLINNQSIKFQFGTLELIK